MIDKKEKRQNAFVVKGILTMATVSALVVNHGVVALAASPEFARTPEQWEQLRDNVLEYQEIEDLITEYNATVQKNNITLKNFKDDFGETNLEVSNRYRELADEIEASIEIPSVDSPTYAMAISGLLNAPSSVEDYKRKAEEAIEDSVIHQLTFESAEKTLVSVAQTQMINYYNSLLQEEKSLLNYQMVERQLQSTMRRKEVGLATDLDILMIQEQLKSMEQGTISAKSSGESAKKTLQVMLGWKENDTPEITALPILDLTWIDQVNLIEDKEKAIENNYTLKINMRKLENATQEDLREDLETTIRENEEVIAVSITNGYQNLLSAKLSYEIAVQQASLEHQNLANAQLNYNTGTLSVNQLADQSTATSIADLGIKEAELALYQAIENYNWAVKGLAKVS